MQLRRTQIVTNLFKHLFPQESILESLLSIHLLPGSSFVSNLSRLKTTDFDYPGLSRLAFMNRITIPLYLASTKKGYKKYFSTQFRSLLTQDYLQLTHKIKQQHTASLHTLAALKPFLSHITIMKSFIQSSQWLSKSSYKLANDLDLLIPNRLYQPVAERLLKIGYAYFPEPTDSRNYRTLSAPDFFQPKEEEIFKKDALTLELHTLLVINPLSHLKVLDQKRNEAITQDLYGQTESITWNRLRIRVFPPTSLVLSFFLHSMFQHNLQGITSYYELAQVLKIHNAKISWKFIWKFLAKYRLTVYFLWFLVLFDSIFPGQLPSHVQRRLATFSHRITPHQLLLLFYMKYKIWHPTNYVRNLPAGRRKDYTWAVINKEFGKLLSFKLLSRISGGKVSL